METAELTNPQSIENFILGGNATFTLKSDKSGKHLTFKAEKVDGCDNRFFVKMLTGNDNENDYSYIGMIVEKTFKAPVVGAHANVVSHIGWKFITTKASRINEQSDAFKGLNYVLENTSINKMPAGIHVWHEGRCCKCGRKLTVPTSIASGIGPECAKQAYSAQTKVAETLDIPVYNMKPLPIRSARGGMNND